MSVTAPSASAKPASDHHARFIELLQTSLEQNGFIKLVLAKYVGEEADLQRIIIKPVTVKAQIEGRCKGYFVVGENPAVGSANGRMQRFGLAALDWLVVRDLVLIESATFWKDSPEIETGVATGTSTLNARSEVERTGRAANVIGMHVGQENAAKRSTFGQQFVNYFQYCSWQWGRSLPVAAMVVVPSFAATQQPAPATKPAADATEHLLLERNHDRAMLAASRYPSSLKARTLAFWVAQNRLANAQLAAARSQTVEHRL